MNNILLSSNSNGLVWQESFLVDEENGSFVILPLPLGTASTLIGDKAIDGQALTECNNVSHLARAAVFFGIGIEFST